jgi:hypothetical protein
MNEFGDATFSHTTTHLDGRGVITLWQDASLPLGESCHVADVQQIEPTIQYLDNIAIAGNRVYLVEPQTDSITHFCNLD